jgi:hypothetical protein
MGSMIRRDECGQPLRKGTIEEVKALFECRRSPREVPVPINEIGGMDLLGVREAEERRGIAGGRIGTGDGVGGRAGWRVGFFRSNTEGPPGVDL